MGNYISCRISSSNSGGGKEHKLVTKVMIPSGEIRELNGSVKAAEVMLETPNFFLVDTKSLRMGRRLPALCADHDLEMGSVYVMFPMNRLNSIVTSSDMGALFLTAVASPKPKSKPKRQLSGGGGKARVQLADHHHHEDRVLIESWQLQSTQETTENNKGPKLNWDDIEDFSAPEIMHRLSMCRSKKPLLETIAEEPVSICSW